MEQRKDTVEQLTVRWAGTEQDARTPATRLRMERLIGSIELSPAGMPPGAVLIIRRLDGLPPLTDLSGLPLDWSRLVQQRLTELYRRAEHPVDGYVSPGAMGIVFDDTAQMLLTLTRDVLSQPGTFLQRWYWRKVLPVHVQSASEAIAVMWAENAAALPAVFAALRPVELIQLVQLLRPDDVAQVMRALHARFLLPATVFEIDASVSRLPQDDLPPTAPWRALLPAVFQRLPMTTFTPQAEYLIGLVLTMYQQPTVARSAAFAEQAAHWLYDALSDGADNHEAHRPAAESAEQAHTPAVRDILPPFAQVEQDALADEPLIEQPKSPRPDGVLTQLGGVFYLINLIERLGWWQTAPLSGWAMVETLAHGLLQNAGDEDPMWLVLAELDGREPGEPIHAVWPDDEQTPAVIKTNTDHTARIADDVAHRIGPVAMAWLVGVLDDVRETLRVLLDDEPETLLYGTGQVMTSRTHIDLYLPHDQANVAVRRAGLDNNPGWMPDLGYIVLFHFVEEG